MLRRSVSVLLLVLLVGASSAADKPFPAHRVIGNVYYVGSDALAIFLITTPEGPDPFDPDKMVKARDTWEFKNKDLIVLTGEMEGPDGKMMTVMKATCTRKK